MDELLSVQAARVQVAKYVAMKVKRSRTGTRTRESYFDR